MEAITFNLGICFFAANTEYGSCFLLDGIRLKKAFTITDQNIKLDNFYKDSLSESLTNFGRYPRAQTSKRKKFQKTKSAKPKVKGGLSIDIQETLSLWMLLLQLCLSRVYLPEKVRHWFWQL